MSRSATEYRLEKKFEQRLYIFTAFIFLTLSLMAVQLGNLQLVHGYENRILAKKFVSRQEYTVAPRGLIFDRNYDSENTAEPLVKNIQYIDFAIYPSRFRDRKEGEAFLREFSRIMGHPFEDYSDIVEPTNWKRLVRNNESITLLTRINRMEHERLAEFHMVTKYGQFITNHLRYYTMGPAMAHVSGYVGLPSRRDLELKLAQPYQTIGKGGIESQYDTELRGIDGIRVRHRIMDSEEQIAESEQGSNLVLTIDEKIQAAAYRALLHSGLRGTVVVMKAKTGEILALVSTPAYDPNILSSGTKDERSDHFRQVMNYEGFLNIAIQSRFPPASTFKPLVAIAGLETPGSGLTENTTYFCPGKWTLQSTMPGVPPSSYFCWDHSGHGTNDLIGGIAHSCDVYFYQWGYKLGPTPIIHYARAFGLDKKTGIDLPGEINGFVPDQRWKQITWSSRWYDGDTINLSIGQGFLETTPIEMSVLYSSLVNGGKIYRPYLLKEIRDPVTNRILQSNQPELIKEIPISASSLDSVRRGMRAVVTKGTTKFLAAPGYVPIAGKTGTVQTRNNRTGRNHAWFIGYAPFGFESEDPIVVTVFLEYGMGGSATAAPVAGEVFKAAYPDWKPPASASIEDGNGQGLSQGVQGGATGNPIGGEPSSTMPSPRLKTDRPSPAQGGINPPPPASMKPNGNAVAPVSRPDSGSLPAR